MRFKFYIADDIKEDYDQLPGSSELNFKAGSFEISLKFRSN